MKILIVNNMHPFRWGDAEELAVNLKNHLIAKKHEAEILRIPFLWNPVSYIPSQMLMVQALELPNVDHVIALKFPAYLIRHPHKTLWLLHQHLHVDDLYENDFPHEIHQRMKTTNEQALGESLKIFVHSEAASQRLAHYNFNSEILLPPLNHPELFTGGLSEGYIFVSGRIGKGRHQHLLLQSLAQTPKNTRLVIAGQPDSPEDAKKLIETVERLGLSTRVKLEMRFLRPEERAHYVNHAAACVYLPLDENTLGYPVMEAAAAGKALIAIDNHEAVLGLVKHLETGWVAKASSEALAQAMAKVNADPKVTEDMGKNAQQLWISKQVSWPNTIKKLMDGCPPS